MRENANHRQAEKITPGTEVQFSSAIRQLKLCGKMAGSVRVQSGSSKHRRYAENMASFFRNWFRPDLPVGRDEFTRYLLRMVLIQQRPKEELSWECCKLGFCNADDPKSIDAIRKAIDSGAETPRDRPFDIMKDIAEFYVAWPASNQAATGQFSATEIAIIDPYEPFDTSTYAGCRSITGVDFKRYGAPDFEITR